MAMPFSNDKDPDNPSTTSLEWDAMIEIWVLIETLLAGTKAMRNEGRLYLPQHPEESDANYNERRQVNVLFNATELTLDGFVGRPFSDPVKLNEDVPENIVDMTTNIDLQGNDITTFCREWFREGISKGFAHVLVDMPSITEEEKANRTLADDNREGRRPYCVLIKPENLIAAEAQIVVDPISGELREWYTHVRIREELIARVGFAQTVTERIRVLEPGTFAVWEKIKSKKKKEEWRVVEAGVTGLPFIPLLTYYSQRDSFLLAKPPLEDLAHMNIRHWQSMSDQINILTVVRFPMLAVAGATDQSGNVMRVGPRQLLGTKDPNGRFYYVEHTGKSIESGSKELADLEEKMMAYGATFLKRRPGNETATGRALDSAESNSELQDMTLRFIDSVNNMLDFMAKWIKLDDGGTVEILSEFGVEKLEKEHTSILKDLRAGRDISRLAIITEAKTLGVLNDKYDPEADMAQLLLEDKTLKPIQPQVPGTFDPAEGEVNPGRPNPTGGKSDGDSKSGT